MRAGRAMEINCFGNSSFSVRRQGCLGDRNEETPAVASRGNYEKIYVHNVKGINK